MLVQLTAQIGQLFGERRVQSIDAAGRVATLSFCTVDICPRGHIEHDVGVRVTQECGERVGIEYVELSVARSDDFYVACPQFEDARADQSIATQNDRRPQRHAGSIRATHAAQQTYVPLRPRNAMGCLVILLALILATLLAGPIGFVLAAVLILGWAVVTGSLRLLWNIVLLPLRLLEALARGR
jgi:hypothetical protein